MIFARFGRTVLLAGAAVLIIVACARLTAAAEPPLVTSDETAHLPPTVTLSMRGEEFLDEAAPRSEPLHAEQPDLLPAPLRRGAKGEGISDARFGWPFISCNEEWKSWSRLRAMSQPAALLTGAHLPSGEGFTSDAFTRPDPSAADAPLAFSYSGELPPVVRGQSASIELLPLATGEASIKNTSLLSAITGTKGRLRADYLTDFDGTDRIGVQALTQTWLGLGIDTEANYWQRPVRDMGIEPLWTGDLYLIYSFVPHPRFKLRSGAGAAWRVEDGKPHAGYNVTHGLDVYLLWRFMFSGEIDWGAIDDDKLLHYRAALGLTWRGLEFFTGYDRYKLGDERLDGWVNGVQFWY
ncbi:MAG: hypothetical protein M3552_14725 [Planctomycetota bacterium]|nr:hypothetical protein [Planctomycetota bacterium]